MDVPTDYDGWLARGRWLYGRCHVAQACDRAYSAVGYPPHSPFRQCFDGAREALAQALALRPDSADAWFLLGQLLVEFEDGHEEEAGRVFERVVELLPANAEAWMWLGAVASCRGDLPLAGAHLTRALSLDPDLRNWAVDLYRVPRDAWDRFWVAFFPEWADMDAEPGADP